MLEKIYTDFTTKLLPKVAEGFTITREYFTDLFGRYVKYLILTDSVGLAISVIMIVIGLVLLKKLPAYIKKKQDEDYYQPYEFLYFIPAMIIIFGFISAAACFINLSKDIYIPEVRMYEELKNFNK